MTVPVHKLKGCSVIENAKSTMFIPHMIESLFGHARVVLVDKAERSKRLLLSQPQYLELKTIRSPPHLGRPRESLNALLLHIKLCQERCRIAGAVGFPTSIARAKSFCGGHLTAAVTSPGTMRVGHITGAQPTDDHSRRSHHRRSTH
jgi:hypothetical protein